MNTLSAEKRDMQIKAKKLRREGFVTGNVFGKNMEGSMPLKIEKKEAERILRTCNKGSQLILTVEGQKMPVLLKEIDYNAMKHEIVEMDFQALILLGFLIMRKLEVLQSQEQILPYFREFLNVFFQEWAVRKNR